MRVSLNVMGGEEWPEILGGGSRFDKHHVSSDSTNEIPHGQPFEFYRRGEQVRTTTSWPRVAR